MITCFGVNRELKIKVREYERKFEEQNSIIDDLTNKLSTCNTSLFVCKNDLKGCNSNLSSCSSQVEDLQTLISPPFEIDDIVEKDPAWIDNVIKDAHDNRSGVIRLPMDSEYFLCKQDDMKKIIEWDWVDAKQYIKNKRDCENFAFWFKARVDGVFLTNGVGLVIDWSGAHAYNIIVFPDMTVWLFEPQTDEYWNLRSHTYEGSFKLNNAHILI